MAMLHVKVMHFGDVKNAFAVRGLAGCVATPGLSLECRGFIVVFRAHNEYMCYRRTQAASSGVTWASLKEAVVGAGGVWGEISEAVQCLQPRLKDLCDIDEAGLAKPFPFPAHIRPSPVPGASSAPPVALPEGEGVFRSGKGLHQVIVYDWGNEKEWFRVEGDLFMFEKMLLRKIILGQDCFVRIVSSNAFSMWSGKEGVKGGPSQAQPSLWAAAQRMGLPLDRKAVPGVLSAILRPLRQQMDSKVPPMAPHRERSAAAVASASIVAAAAAQDEDEAEDRGGAEEEGDEDFEAGEQRSEGDEEGGSNSNSEGGRPPVLPPVVFHEPRSSIDILDWGTRMFRLDTRSPQPILFRVGLMMVQTSGRLRFVLTCDKAEVSGGKFVQQFRAWKYGSAESKTTYATWASALKPFGVTQNVPMCISKPLMRILQSRYPEECKALLAVQEPTILPPTADSRAVAPVRAPTSPASPASPAAPAVTVKRERVAVDATEKTGGESENLLKVEPLPVVSAVKAAPSKPSSLLGEIVWSSSTGKLVVISWGSNPFFAGERGQGSVYADGLLLQCEDKEEGWIALRCAGETLFRVWRVAEPEPTDLYPRAVDAMRSMCESTARGNAVWARVGSRVQAAVKRYYGIDMSSDTTDVEGRFEEELDGNGEWEQEAKRIKSCNVATDFTFEEDVALVDSLQEACMCGQSGASLLEPPCPVLDFPRKWIAFKVRGEGHLHERLRPRSEAELVGRFEQLSDVVRAEIVRECLRGNNLGRITDFSFLRRQKRKHA